MKNFFLLFFLCAFAFACKKDAPIPTGGNHPPPSASFGGVYNGLFYQHVAGVDSDGVYKFDTTFIYKITVIDEGGNKITIHGATPVDAIEVDATGYFEFNDYNRKIEGNFEGDSLHIYSDAISGTYSPPQFYNNTQMYFDGKKE